MVALFDNLDAHTLIPDLLAHRPHTRVVLDRYGLKGCGVRAGRWKAWASLLELTMCRWRGC